MLACKLDKQRKESNEDDAIFGSDGDVGAFDNVSGLVIPRSNEDVGVGHVSWGSHVWNRWKEQMERTDGSVLQASHWELSARSERHHIGLLPTFIAFRTPRGDTSQMQ